MTALHFDLEERNERFIPLSSENKLRHDVGTAPEVAGTLAADPDQAWKVLSLATDWLKHAESKAAATLAAAGVIGGVLYGLVTSHHDHSAAVGVASAICGLLTLTAAFLSGVSLLARVNSTEKPISLLYFHHIARQHSRSAGSADFAAAFRVLTSDPEQLVSEIADQLWAISHVARQKYRWGNLGILTMLLALLALATIAVIIPTQ
jgi:hypothetical protein